MMKNQSLVSVETEVNPVDTYLEAVGAAEAREIVSETRVPSDEVYSRLVALESAGKATVVVSYSGKRVIERLWTWK